MRVATFRFTPSSGWSVDEFPLADSSRTLVLIFAAPEYFDRPGPIFEIFARYPRSVVVGCSTAGEIEGPRLHEGGIVVSVTEFESTDLAVAAVEVGAHGGSRESGAELGRRLVHEGLRAVFVLSDGLSVDGSELAHGFNSSLPEGVIVTGGLAGDSLRFERTFIVHDGRLVEGWAVAVGFYGDKFIVGNSAGVGFDKFGHERTVTRAEGSALYELDGKPALDVYRMHVGSDVEDLVASSIHYPVAIREPGQTTPLVRAIMEVDELQRMVRFAGAVREGSYAQFLYTNEDRVISAASEVGREADGDGEGPALAIEIVCVGRKMALGSRAPEDIEAVDEGLSDSVQVVGFYAYGEICPISSGRAELHNQSVTLTTYREAS